MSRISASGSHRSGNTPDLWNGMCIMDGDDIQRDGYHARDLRLSIVSTGDDGGDGFTSNIELRDPDSSWNLLFTCNVDIGICDALDIYTAGSVSKLKGEVAGVGAGLGILALLLAALLIWREFTWRRKSGRQPQSAEHEDSQIQAPWLGASAFIDDANLGHQLPDYDVSSAVHQLLDDVKTWAQQIPLSSTPVTVTHLRAAEDVSRVMRVLPQMREIEDLPLYVSDRKRLRCFIRGLVGVVVESMFSAAQETEGQSVRHHWLPADVDTSVGTLEKALLLQASPPRTIDWAQDRAVDLQNFHEWRAITFSLLAKSCGDSSGTWSDEVNTYIRAQAETTVRLVGLLVDGSDRRAQLQDSLVPILTRALELACLLHRQKASWSLRFPGIREHPVNYTISTSFSEKTMVDISGSDVSTLQTVEILVAPGLFKTGNTDGQLYAEGESVVRKAEVWCYST
ncbi:hypothetical protein SLS53_005929 [Cytospora paraplurivora]|uniref:Uncharacterized protein n=1 Tax=Cytospora paraplurivora TaxID=2898453 RepID=A0AAN9YEJ8_9PEZI